MANLVQRIVPNLWYDTQAAEAAGYYTLAFNNSKTGTVVNYGQAGARISGKPPGSVMTVAFELEGHEFVALNGGPQFKFNPSISFLVACKSRDEVDILWQKLDKGGSALMDLGEYPFSERYGWTQDRFGLSWQVMFMGKRKIAQKITPTLMFVGEHSGQAEKAINFYVSVFHKAKIGDISRYDNNQSPDVPGTILHAAFTLENQEFAAMDSARMHDFTFNEAISLVVNCQTQQEIDYYWDKLLAQGGQEGACGWLKDRYGVSWQVTPVALPEMLRDPDKQKVERVTSAFLNMKKFNIAALLKAFEGAK
jgi:predicted 3-demethylubiquinone-9 3-methyltransferase (glyoxalase superfamily)